jgi:hypothetical protein
LAERVLEEVAKSWKNRNGGVIVEGDGNDLKDILMNLEGSMSGGRIVASREITRQNSLVLGSSQHGEVSHTRMGLRPNVLGREDSQSSLGMSTLDMGDEDEEGGLTDPRKWLKVIDAFDQPRLVYNVGKKHFDRCVPETGFDSTYADPFPERHQNHHYCRKHHIKHRSSGIATTSSTNASSEMSPSKRLPLKLPKYLHWLVHPRH